MLSAATRRAVLVGGALLALLALVALASRGHVAGPGGGETRHVRTGPVVEWVLLVMLVLAVIEIPLIVASAFKAKDDPDVLPKRGNWMLRAFATMTLFAAASLAFAYWRRDHGRHSPAFGSPSPKGFAHGKAHHAASGSSVAFDWLPVVVVLSIVLAGAVVGAVFFLRSREKAPPESQLVASLAEALDESLDDLRRERDPRRAVIAAYARMERALALSGLPRRTAEAPLEYLARVLGDLLRTSSESVARLTALFERAKFSAHEIGTDMKDEAIEALGAVREELRAIS